MSKAGIQSNRGDYYQTLVAFDWALKVLTNSDYLWLEVDTVQAEVDDVVVGKSDGTVIYCQCKKNQPKFTAWSISDLEKEIEKAKTVLASKPSTQVRFYSRSPFGSLHKLHESRVLYPDESLYLASLASDDRDTDTQLKQIIAPTLTTFEFLRRTNFETTQGFDALEVALRDRLSTIASNPKAAFNALWTALAKLAARAEDEEGATAKHRLSKSELTALLVSAGAMLTPPINVAEVLRSFKSTSAIGRVWRRTIGDNEVPRNNVEKIIAAISGKPKTILITGGSGSGKTCVILAVQERLEEMALSRNDIVPLFIQSRDFADMSDVNELQEFGLPEQLVEKVARIADESHVVVAIDSLDVLSIAREHKIFRYFLAKIDRLLQIPNVTVLTACREFDRHYDRRIQQRTWDHTFTCEPLDWDTEVAPLLNKLGIETNGIDEATRELIRNPRELDLFVELTRTGGTVNAVSSQALATCYLMRCVRDVPTLGDDALQALETFATAMLKARSLSLPKLRFASAGDVVTKLLSLNILRETNGALMFGHQSLLDVLVISGAIRRGETLEQFIEGLAPVPFVRPTIRSFVAHLAAGERRDFRKQVRTVLMSEQAFHIRRLVAEVFAEQVPHDEDWPLLRDLHRNEYRMFQAIYFQAKHLEWHHFWMKHLIPELKRTRNGEGLIAHVHHLGKWKDTDPKGVIAYWKDALEINSPTLRQWVTWRLDMSLLSIAPEHSELIAPLLMRLIKLPRAKDNVLGRVMARCISMNVLDDAALWDYIVGDVTNEDVGAYNFNHQLHCGPTEFGELNNTFLNDRMKQSPELLNLAVATLERWSHFQRGHRYTDSGIFGEVFLHYSSHSITHSKHEHRQVGSPQILMNAIEDGVVHHAKTNSSWWLKNRDRLSVSPEGTVRYFSIRACSAAPEANARLAGRMLTDKHLLSSTLAFEAGNLMKVVYIRLSSTEQDAIQHTIETLALEAADWELGKIAKLILVVPPHLRSRLTQDILNYSAEPGAPLIREPEILTFGGTVTAPFPFEVFLAASHDEVLKLFDHYVGHSHRFSEDLVGGEAEVAYELQQAASRSPTRFLAMLRTHWNCIALNFCDSILAGVADNLASRFGNLNLGNNWIAVEEPEGLTLARQVLEELARHSVYWRDNPTAANALRSCSNVVKDIVDAECVVFMAIRFASQPHCRRTEGRESERARKDAAAAVMQLAEQLSEACLPWPELLIPALKLFASDEASAVRETILAHLPVLQQQHAALGWHLFDRAIAPGLWKTGERCLYYAYARKFEFVGPRLERLLEEGTGKDLATWGRISALCAFPGLVDFSDFVKRLIAIKNNDAWCGASGVWSTTENVRQYQEQCMAGLDAGLIEASVEVLQQIGRLLCEESVVQPPMALLQRYFAACGSNSKTVRDRSPEIHAWLNIVSSSDPMYALAIAEFYVSYVKTCSEDLYDHENHIAQLLTRLFAQAEEQEEADGGAMLRRVLAVHDKFLELDVDPLQKWLAAAERP